MFIQFVKNILFKAPHVALLPASAVEADRVLLQTNSKKYFRKITALLAIKTVLSHFITFKEHMPSKADTTRL